MGICKICKTKTKRVMSFGRMPISNGFISKISEKEFFFNLIFCFCPTCFMVQLKETVKPQMMFNKQYHFISSTSSTMSLHFKEMADEITRKLIKKKSPLIVELGCNDGIMLKHIAARGLPHLGVEPSSNVAQLARRNGVKVWENFFNQKTAEEIVDKFGHADIICGANVMCHIESINSVFIGAKILLKDDGVLFFEDPYLLDIVKRSSFDQIYDEHIYYFSGLSIRELARHHNLELVDMVHQDVHGGSMRYYIQKANKRKPSSRVESFIANEKKYKLNEFAGYLDFKNNVNKICKDLNNILNDIRKKGNRIVGYGATSKSTTLLNYVQIGTNIIDYISDITPTKINKFTPGTHIPVKSHDFFKQDNPPYVLLLAWNHKKEILEKEKYYHEKGGKFITFFPHVLVE